jgi:hypothetical protein
MIDLRPTRVVAPGADSAYQTALWVGHPVTTTLRWHGVLQ